MLQRLSRSGRRVLVSASALPLVGAALLAGVTSASAIVPPPLNCTVNTSTPDAHALAAATGCDSTLGVGKVTLRSAIEAFNAAVNGTDGTIGFSLSPGSVIKLTLGQLRIMRQTGTLTINGPGARLLAVDGNAASRVFEADSGTTVAISHLTVRNGSTGGNGGAIQTFGALTLSADTFTGNHAAYAGAIDVRNGTPPPHLTMTGSTVTGNFADSEGDAAISIEGSGDVSTMTNDTIVNNVNNGSGEATAIEVYGAGVTLNLNFVTIAGNRFAAAQTSGLPVAALGVFNTATAHVHNTVIANNTTGISKNCGTNEDSAIVDQGYNLDSANQCGFTAGKNDLVNAGALLGVLGNNGGQTDTMALGSGSPAIDAADPGCLQPTDQRGVTRPQGPRCDIGAFELAAAVVNPTPSPSATPSATPALPKAGAGGAGAGRPIGAALIAFVILSGLAALRRPSRAHR